MAKMTAGNALQHPLDRGLAPGRAGRAELSENSSALKWLPGEAQPSDRASPLPVRMNVQDTLQYDLHPSQQLNSPPNRGGWLVFI